jgi:hypothetical protein
VVPLWSEDRAGAVRSLLWSEDRAGGRPWMVPLWSEDRGPSVGAGRVVVLPSGRAGRRPVA